jgi:hypothetical protein
MNFSNPNLNCFEKDECNDDGRLVLFIQNLRPRDFRRESDFEYLAATKIVHDPDRKQNSARKAVASGAPVCHANTDDVRIRSALTNSAEARPRSSTRTPWRRMNVGYSGWEWRREPRSIGHGTVARPPLFKISEWSRIEFKK